MSNEAIRQQLLDRYISTGKVGFTRPKNDDEAIDLIETVVAIYNTEPNKMSLCEMSKKLKDILDF